MSNPKKPIWLHKISGSFRKHRHAEREAAEMSISCGRIGKPPAFISENPTAMAEWDRLTKNPAYRMLLAPEFWPLLVEYCAVTAEVMSDPNATVAARRHRLRLAGELSLTPASRSLTPLPAPARATTNEFDDVG